MNEILKLKKKYSCPSSKDLCKIINQHKTTTDSFIRENETRISEDQIKIEDLSRQLSIAKDKLDIEKKVREEKSKELRTENEKLKDLQTENNRIVKNNFKLEKKCHKLRMNKPNIKDQFILEHGQKKFNLYKQLTRIRWNFGTLHEAIKGYIQQKELSDILWNEIELSTKKEVIDEQNKENSSSNIDNNYHSSLNVVTKQIT